MIKTTTTILFFLFNQIGYSQIINIGILTDKSSDESSLLLDELQKEIKAVVGQEGTVVFKNILENNVNSTGAKFNYETLIASDTDIILAFGVINNVMLHQQKVYDKPTIVFGSVNNDFMDLPKNQKTSGINNITYRIAPLSYTADLDVFKSLYDYKNIDN